MVRICLLALLPSLALSGPATKPIAELPFKSNGALVVLTVRVQDSRPLQFALDSGVSVSEIDSGVARSLGLKATGSVGGGAGTVRFDFYRDLKLASGDFQWVVPIIYRASFKVAGSPVPEDGLLGADFLEKFVIQIDYVQHVLRLYDPKTYRYDGIGSAVPLAFSTHRPFVMVAIKVQGREPVSRQLLIDTGSTDILDDPIIGAGPIEWVRIGKLITSKLEGVANSDPLIGEGVLRRFKTVTFDYARRKVYFDQ